jgi:hypothetical protein
VFPVDIRKTTIVMSIIILALIPILAGCSGSSPSASSVAGYKEANVTKQGTTFSFEYPGNYIDGYDTMGEDSPDVNTVNLGVPINADISNQNPNLAIILINNNAEAKTTLDKRLQDNQQKDASSQYQLIERSSIKISGIDAQSAAYSIVLSPDKSGRKSIVREAFLNHSNFLWVIGVSCYEDKSAEAKEAFDRLIKTFKFKN